MNKEEEKKERWDIPYWDKSLTAEEFYSSEFGEIDHNNGIPILYHDKYNISFWGIEKIHPFDSNKFKRVINKILKEKVIKKKQLVNPGIVTNKHLSLIHTQEYLDSLKSSWRVAEVAEFPPLAFFPNYFVRTKFLEPMQRHVAGTILGGYLSLTYGWAINIGGGMHHAYTSNGGGWCVWNDIALSYQHLRLFNLINTACIIDLDVHQGNGIERTIIEMDDLENIFVMDVYRRNIYPGDNFAKRAINWDNDGGIYGNETDEEYLNIVRNGLEEIFENYTPDIVYYNAGTDILIGDPLGNMNISPECVIARDELVFRACRERNIPIVMVLSGGYTKPLSGETIGRSIVNLHEKNLLEINNNDRNDDDNMKLDDNDDINNEDGKKDKIKMKRSKKKNKNKKL